jgi:hypothetical protein
MSLLFVQRKAREMLSAGVIRVLLPTTWPFSLISVAALD